MAHVGIPNTVVDCIRRLYKRANITPMLGGQSGTPIERHRGLHQGDPLSCMLYLLVIELVAYALRAPPRIEGLSLNGTPLWKVLMFADDTVVIIRNQSEADEVTHVFNQFEEAIGQRVNWTKSYLLPIGRTPPLRIPNVRALRDTEYFTYLGIPVGPRGGCRGSNETWNKVLTKMETTQRTWSKARLSTRRRVLIANTLIMSLPRYYLKFLYPCALVQRKIEQTYWRMVWDGKRGGHLKKELAVASNSQGGLGCMDLKSIIGATVVSTVQRARQTPAPLWARLITHMYQIKPSRTKSLRRELLTDPWFQTVSKRPITPPACVAQMVGDWRRLQEKAIRGEVGTVRLVPPRYEGEVRLIKFWYHPIV